MRKQSQIVFIALSLLALPISALAQFTYITNNGTITITGYTGADGAVAIPAAINGFPVISIGDSAFAYSDLTNVMIPNSVTSIGNEAFYATSLSGVTIPDSVTNIGDLAFSDTGLTNVTIPDSVTSIGEGPFLDCIALTAITVNSSNPAYSSLNGVLLDKSQATLLQYPSGNTATNYAIPNSVTNIEELAFESCFSLASVTIPDSVTSIGSTFEDCSGLTSVTIGNGVISIAPGAFAYCGLVNVTIGNGIKSIGNDAFAECPSLASVFIAANVPSVGFDAFCLHIHDEFGFSVFENATVYYLAGTLGWSNTLAVSGPLGTTLSTVMLHASPQFGTTDDGLAYLSDNLQTIITGYTGSNGAVIIPANIGGVPVTSIADYGFKGSALTNVTIGSGVTTIGASAFDNCLSLSSVYFNGNAPNADPSVFGQDYNGYDPATVYYLPGTLGWSNTFAGRPTALWFLPRPLILNQGPGFGVQSNQFGFTISWATNIPIVVEACTNLSNPVWMPVSTNALVGGASHFTDPRPANLPGRYYRLRSP